MGHHLQTALEEAAVAVARPQTALEEGEERLQPGVMVEDAVLHSMMMTAEEEEVEELEE